MSGIFIRHLIRPSLVQPQRMAAASLSPNGAPRTFSEQGKETVKGSGKNNGSHDGDVQQQQQQPQQHQQQHQQQKQQQQHQQQQQQLNRAPRRRRGMWGGFEDDFNRMFQTPFFQQHHHTEPSFSPAIDLIEESNIIKLTADLPGVKKSDIDLRIEGDVLSLSGVRGSEVKEEGKNFARMERSFGSFVRRFRLPEDIDQQNIEASLNDGVLEVKLKKLAEEKPKTININVV